MRPAFLTVALALALSGCGGTPEEGSPVARIAGFPALFEVTDSAGKVEGWLFGTIHTLPDGVQWRSDGFNAVVQQADLLVVEVNNVSDDAALGALFRALAYDEPAGPSIGERLDPSLRPDYTNLLEQEGASGSQFDAMESWAAALGIAQLVQHGESENGVDRLLLGEFASREVIELEGAREQLSVFDDLPEKEQRDLLGAVIREAALPQGERDSLAANWKSGNLEQLEKVTRQGMLADPELRQALLVDRNRDWATKIENLLSTEARPLVAVGAGHLLGPDGLPSLLEASGYKVRRIQ